MVFFPYLVQILSLPYCLTMNYYVYYKGLLENQPLLTIPVADAREILHKAIKNGSATLPLLCLVQKAT